MSFPISIKNPYKQEVTFLFPSLKTSEYAKNDNLDDGSIGGYDLMILALGVRSRGSFGLGHQLLVAAYTDSILYH